MRLGTMNIGTMTGKGNEIVDMMQRRKIDILCVQETRWKGSKARMMGNGYKMYYNGKDSRNGVGIVLSEALVESVIEVVRVSDRLMRIRLVINGVVINIVCAYAPQVGSDQEEKMSFWESMDNIMQEITQEERVFIGGDLNGHVGEGNEGEQEVLGKHGFGVRNAEGQMVIDYAKRMNMGILNTYFMKRSDQRVTYCSGGRKSQIDYILGRKKHLKEVQDCKVIPGESVAKQHRLVLGTLKLQVRKEKREIPERKIKWWKLGSSENRKALKEKVLRELREQSELPSDWKTTAQLIRAAGKEVLGETTGRWKAEKEAWWWNDTVQEAVKAKKEAKKAMDKVQTEESKERYREAEQKAKVAVSISKRQAYDGLYEQLEMRGGEKSVFRLAKQRGRASKDIQHVRIIKDENGMCLTNEEEIRGRWKSYFEKLMNVENSREPRSDLARPVQKEVGEILTVEVMEAVEKMKYGKAVGPDNVPSEAWVALEEIGAQFLTQLFNRLLSGEAMPEEWRKSLMVPIYKNKGGAQECGNYRGIKLLSHTMKIWERVLDQRMRECTIVSQQQFGFMPGKGTSDPVFALRLLMEKFKEGQKGLHLVFVDLEKAYDRVPREELWHCMRSSEIAEPYVRAVQDMYKECTTAIRTAAGLTESFQVKVGLHQGSALSPFLFALIMDRLTDELREEPPWTMMFADDIVLCGTSIEEVEEKTERWRQGLERRGMRVSRTKTEYMCFNDSESPGCVTLEGLPLPKVDSFKYLGCLLQNDGKSDREVKRKVQAGWNAWRKITGVLCERRIAPRVKGKIYKVVVRPAMTFGLETLALTKKQTEELETAEMSMLRFSLGVTRLDKIRNTRIRGTAHTDKISEKLREARLRWYGHVMRREEDHVGKRMLKLKPPGKRSRGRPARRYMDGIKEDMEITGVRKEMADDRELWGRMIRCGNPE